MAIGQDIKGRSESRPASGEKPVALSIVIVSYNTREILRQCLASVLSQTRGISYRVYVVDNASRDGSAEMVRRDFPDVILEANRENVGFARANNQALRKIESRYALLLNSDTELFPGTDVLKIMVDFLDRRPEIGALGPKIVFEDGTIQLHCARSLPNLWTTFCELSTLARRFPRSRITGNYLMSWWDHESSREVDCLLGACMMVRREVLDRVGLLDEDFFLGGEDADWCLRIKRAGWKVYYQPEVVILHYGGASKDQMDEHEGKERHIAYWKYFRKHHGPAYALASRGMTAILSLAWVVIYTLQRPFRPSRRKVLKSVAEVYSGIFAWCLTGR